MRWLNLKPHSINERVWLAWRHAGTYTLSFASPGCIAYVYQKTEIKIKRKIKIEIQDQSKNTEPPNNASGPLTGRLYMCK